ncbi:MAG: division/cell wall cluster transcriptional repressor MraZ [Myxococcota bacterium]
MFQGLHHHLLDEKGRLAFPSPFRMQLAEQSVADRFVLTQSFYEPCLVGWTEEQFSARVARVRALPPSNPAVMDFKRVVIASATPVTVDKAGRVSIPKELRDYAGLEREVVWAGVDENVEIWSKGRWDERNTRRLADRVSLDESRRFFEQNGL